MDDERFDGLTRALGAGTTRRGAVGLLAGLAGLGLGEAAAKERRKTKAKQDRKRKVRKKPPAPAPVAAEAAACASPGPSSNLSGCNFNNRDFAGIDLSSSRMVGTRFRGTDLCGADLSSSNLKDADFRGFAEPGRATNLFRADLSSSGCGGTRFNTRTRFCGTRTCNGSISNRDCPAGVDPAAVCCADDECAAERVCRDGACVPTCDVCPSGCRYDSVADAVADPDGPTTISICRGLYPESVVIAKDVTLVGAGASQDPATGTVLDGGLDGGFQRQILRIESGATVTLQRLTVRHGHAEDGGCIDNRGSLTLEEADVRDCQASNLGGCIDNRGALTLDRATVGGCIAHIGGGIYNGGTAILDRTTVVACDANHGGGIANDGDLTLDDATVTRCVAILEGGGITTSGALNLKGATLISHNRIHEFGSDPGHGEGVLNQGGTVACEGAPRVCSNPNDATATRETNCDGVSAASCAGVCFGDYDSDLIPIPGSGACPA